MRMIGALFVLALASAAGCSDEAKKETKEAAEAVGKDLEAAGEVTKEAVKKGAEKVENKIEEERAD